MVSKHTGDLLSQQNMSAHVKYRQVEILYDDGISFVCTTAPLYWTLHNHNRGLLWY